MAWNAPLRLQDRVARVLARTIISITEERVRSALATVPAKMLVARATAGLIRQRATDYEDEENCFADDEYESEYESDAISEEIEYREELDIMDLALVRVKEALVKVQKWLSTIPQNKAGPRGPLEEAFDTYTEVHPKHDEDFPKHLTYLVLKLLVLGSVFIDRDYGDKDKRCVVPFAWEGWVARLMRRIGPFNRMHELKIYGGMYPNILAAILREAPHLKSLFISHINITDEILLAVSKSCTKIERLYLLHNFPWQVISMKAFCAAFFSGASQREISSAVTTGRIRKIKKSFTSLKEVELAYGDITVARDFHKMLLSHYTDLKNFTCEWKTNVFDDDYSTHGHEVLIPITKRGNKLSLTNVYLECGLIYTMGLDQLHNFAWICPDVKGLTLDCTSYGTPKVCEAEGRHILELVMEWPKLESLHLNLNLEHNLTMAYLMPTLTTKGPILKTLILEASTTRQRLHATTLASFLKLCPNLVELKVWVWNRFMLNAPNNGEGLQLPECKYLKQLSFHESGPGDLDSPHAEIGHKARWLAFLEALLTASPNLHTLSISLCRGLSSLLDTLTCNIDELHLHVKSCYEWNPSTDKIRSLVRRLPNLQHLYLEELRGSNYWKVRRHYRHTGLKVHWGNLYGWPRT